MGMKLGNLYTDCSVKAGSETFLDLLKNPKVRIERVVSKDYITPEGKWYDQDQDEWVIVLEGQAKLEFETETIHMKKGDYVYLPAHSRHRVSWSDPNVETIWLAIFY